jgi:hypothetical protein
LPTVSSPNLHSPFSKGIRYARHFKRVVFLCKRGQYERKIPALCKILPNSASTLNHQAIPFSKLDFNVFEEALTIR